MSDEAGDSTFALNVVDRYTEQLLKLAKRRLPERLRIRLDPEDVIQSVYRSFFNRLRQGAFKFEDSHDVWRVLATLTFHKVQNAIVHHQRQRRDVRREQAGANDANAGAPALTPGTSDVAIMYECLEKLLTGLPERYAEIVSLRLQGEAIADIASKVRYSRRTVLRVLEQVQRDAQRQWESTP